LWIVKGRGYVNGEQYFACMDASSQDPGFSWNIDLLLDFREIEEFDVTLDDIKQLKAIELEARKVYGPADYKIAGLTRNLNDFHQMKLYKALLKSPGIDLAGEKDPEKLIIWLEREPYREEILQALADMAIQ